MAKKTLCMTALVIGGFIDMICGHHDSCVMEVCAALIIWCLPVSDNDEQT
jgi:hypothetical protein